MPEIKWDQVGEKVFETGVDRGVLYPRAANGEYPKGFAWNGLTTFTDSPSGAEANPQYADNKKYLNLRSVEEYGGTIEAFTYPKEFEACDGTASPIPGLSIGQQPRLPFGASYRTLIGNDTEGIKHGYKLHLVYGATASPSEQSHETLNDSPEAQTFSWEFDTDPVDVDGFASTSTVVLDSRVFDPADMKAVEDILYGRGTETSARLPLPNELIELLGDTVVTP
jgi:hypothetical protein